MKKNILLLIVLVTANQSYAAQWDRLNPHASAPTTHKAINNLVTLPFLLNHMHRLSNRICLSTPIHLLGSDAHQAQKAFLSLQSKNIRNTSRNNRRFDCHFATGRQNFNRGNSYNQGGRER